MKKLWKYMRDYRREGILAPLFKLLEASLELLVPLVMAQIIDTGIANGDRGFILSRCGILAALAAVGLVCSITAQYFVMIETLQVDKHTQQQRVLIMLPLKD